MKIPFLNLWAKWYWWMPDMTFGYYSSFYNAVRYWVLNVWLFSVEVVDAPIYEDMPNDGMKPTQGESFINQKARI